ncbi:hypothetical protein [Nannocystis pusilla]|uniref:Lipoprotein n=1 Tax=Nannocystis pusilla TaxID=889268 RepID=A0ABS7TNV9_9BACT|nr:hypothetical protein [Nannocystis pusilla]MBZ5709919.1 hypothetical protein [Nannocystis pusilla]
MHRELLKPRREFPGRFAGRDDERRDADDAASSDPVSADPEGTGLAGRHQVAARFESRGERCEVQGDAARGLDGLMTKAAVRGSIRGSAIRRATCLGLVLAALTHASGCGPECDMDRDFVLTVEPVDGDGVHLPIQALEAALDAGEIEICVDGLESFCHTNPSIEFLREKRVFELTRSDLAYPDRRRCELPTVTFSIELPGCEPAEYVLEGGETTNQVKFEIHTGRIEIVCPRT